MPSPVTQDDPKMQEGLTPVDQEASAVSAALLELQSSLHKARNEQLAKKGKKAQKQISREESSLSLAG